MLRIGLIKEGKIPHDNRVALTPGQCNWLMNNNKNISITVQPSANRCFSDLEYQHAGVHLSDDLSHCDILFGIKEVPVEMLLENKTYFFFSHTRKQQPHNRSMLHAMMDKKFHL